MFYWYLCICTSAKCMSVELKVYLFIWSHNFRFSMSLSLSPNLLYRQTTDCTEGSGLTREHCMSYDCHVIMFMTDDFAHIYFVTFLCHMNDCHVYVLFMTDLRGGDIRGNTYMCLYNFTLDFFSMVHILKICLYNIFCM